MRARDRSWFITQEQEQARAAERAFWRGIAAWVAVAWVGVVSAIIWAVR